MWQASPAAAPPTSQLAFRGPEGMTVQWSVATPGRFDSAALVCPGRYNFPQAAIYRLKLANIPGRPGIELYPTIEVGPALPRTEAFLAHNPIPVEFTEEDFDQAISGNLVTKVIYLPDPQFQQLALAGVETLVSTRLDPGVDPVVEADRRGAILGVIRLGNKDMELPGAEGVQMVGGAGATCGPCPMGGMPAGAGGGRPAWWIALRGRGHRSPVRHADVRHADWVAGSAARSARGPGRIATVRGRQPHPRLRPAADPRRAGRREANARLLLSAAGRPRADYRTDGDPGGHVHRPHQ